MVSGTARHKSQPSPRAPVRIITVKSVVIVDVLRGHLPYLSLVGDRRTTRRLGIGAARVAIGETRMTFPKTTTIVPGTSRTGLTWMLTAGLGISLAEQLTFDLAWRYMDYGVIETGEGKGRVEWRDGSREPLALDLARTRAKLRSYGFRLSLRYAF